MSSSQAESDIAQFIGAHYPGKIVRNSRQLLGDGKEIDIYIPELKIGIEYCGVYYHSVKFKDKNYHQAKMRAAMENGIKLYHIYDCEWQNTPEIVKSKILRILKIDQNLEKIPARKCKVKEIEAKVKNEFLEKNHIQGKDMAKIKLGLFYQDRLVSVMTFSKGFRVATGENEATLSRFASDINLNVMGAFSKLLSYFKKNYDYKGCVTHADLRWSSQLDNVYLKNGFEQVEVGNPDYNYYEKNTGQLRHKSYYQKRGIQKLLPEYYDSTKTEFEMMDAVPNIFRIYDCGKVKYHLTW